MKQIDYSIIITHYNQNDYIENCIEKVLNQKNITYQLIIIDDCSSSFDVKHINAFIERTKKENLLKYDIITNDKNIGTVKSINKALANCEGEYIMLIAADDEYSDYLCLDKINKTIKNKYNGKIDILITQQDMYDKELKEFYYKFMEEKYVDNFNNYTNKKIFNILSKGCFFPAGSTVYKKDYIKQRGFDEKYKLIEDWPSFLNASLNNANIKFENIVSINHRDCGLSHSAETTKIHTDFIYDIYLIHKNILIPNLNKMNIYNKFWVVRTYKFYKKNYGHLDPNKDDIKYTMVYKIINILLILWYNFIKIKNFIDTQKYLNYTVIIYLITIYFKKEVLNNLFKIYLIASLLLMISNILYNIIDFIKQKTNKKVERR